MPHSSFPMEWNCSKAVLETEENPGKLSTVLSCVFEKPGGAVEHSHLAKQKQKQQGNKLNQSSPFQHASILLLPGRQEFLVSGSWKLNSHKMCYLFTFVWSGSQINKSRLGGTWNCTVQCFLCSSVLSGEGSHLAGKRRKACDWSLGL